jgi:transketolase
MVNRANSGHPGIVLGSAPMLYTLYTKHLNFDPKEKDWINRDRFILSAGHGSALLYSMLHLSGYDLPMDELKDFRQWGSRTAGHPEYMDSGGIEATTGPLGQGIGMAVGMALAEKYTAAKFNKEDIKIIDHFTYSLCGDGDLQEGVAQEAASLAGHL